MIRLGVLRAPLNRLLCGRYIRAAATNVFHHIYYSDVNTWQRNTWFGYQTLQNPYDLYTYQELICRDAPRAVIQTGVAGGGSVLFFSHILGLLHGSSPWLVVGVDIALSNEAKRLQSDRVVLLEGSSVDAKVIETVKSLTNGLRKMIVLDSDHRESYVFEELKVYGPLVWPGEYLIVEDCNVNGHPTGWSHGPGPLEAVRRYLATRPGFVQTNEIWERNLLSHHNYGWLKRVSD